jgi:hypothetical protein
MERDSPLSRFIDSERGRFRSEDNNKFASSLSQISRYHRFTTIIFGRYKKVSEEFIANAKAQHKSFLEGTHKVNDAQMFLLDESARLSMLLHLEIESFYLFAKILLDKIAHSTEFYFGPVRKRSLDSHDDLCKNLPVFAEQKELVVSPDFLKLAAELKKDVSDYRDYEIAHEKSPRRIRGTIFYGDGKTSISAGNLYPKEDEKQVDSKALDDLQIQIEEYIVQFIKFIKNNRGKTRLQMEPSKG